MEIHNKRVVFAPHAQQGLIQITGIQSTLQLGPMLQPLHCVRVDLPFTTGAVVPRQGTPAHMGQQPLGLLHVARDVSDVVQHGRTLHLHQVRFLVGVSVVVSQPIRSATDHTFLVQLSGQFHPQRCLVPYGLQSMLLVENAVYHPGQTVPLLPGGGRSCEGGDGQRTATSSILVSIAATDIATLRHGGGQNNESSTSVGDRLICHPIRGKSLIG